MDQLTGRCVLVAGVQGPAAAFSRRPLFADWKSCDDIGRAGHSRPSDTGHRNLLDTAHLSHAVKSFSKCVQYGCCDETWKKFGERVKHCSFGEALKYWFICHNKLSGHKL